MMLLQATAFAACMLPLKASLGAVLDICEVKHHPPHPASRRRPRTLLHIHPALLTPFAVPAPVGIRSGTAATP
jgi:hypothetical protein